MASLYQILAAIQVGVDQATQGLSPAPQVAIGWPPINRLQQIGQGAAPPAVAVYDRKVGHNTTRWLTEISAQTVVAAGLTTAVAQPSTITSTQHATITLGGSPIKAGDAVSCVLTRGMPDGTNPWTAAVVAQAPDGSQTAATMAALLAAAINLGPTSAWVSAAAVGAVVTLTPLFINGILSVASNAGNGGTQSREIGRREREVQIVLWAQTEEQRQTITNAITNMLALAELDFGITTLDGTPARLSYGNDYDLEDNTLQDVYRHDFLVTAEYPITTVDQLYAVLAPVPAFAIDA